MGLLGPKNPTIYFPGRFRPYFRPNRPIYVIRYMADSAGNSAGIGRKIIFSDYLGPGGHFAPSIVSITHFATILKFCKYLEIFKNFVCGQNGRNFHPADFGQNQLILLFLAKYFLWQLLWTLNYLWQVFGTSRVTLDPF